MDWNTPSGGVLNLQTRPFDEQCVTSSNMGLSGKPMLNLNSYEERYVGLSCPVLGISDGGDAMRRLLDHRMGNLQPPMVVLEADDGSISSLVSDEESPTLPCCSVECCSLTTTLTESDTSDVTKGFICQACGKKEENEKQNKLEMEEKLKVMQDVDEILMDLEKKVKLSANNAATYESINQNEIGFIDGSKTNLNLNISYEDDTHPTRGRANSKCWKSPDEVRFGQGRVAALARHFSLLENGGIIQPENQGLGKRLSKSTPNVSQPWGTIYKTVSTEGNYNLVYRLGSSLDELRDKSVSVNPVSTESDKNLYTAKNVNGNIKAKPFFNLKPSPIRSCKSESYLLATKKVRHLNKAPHRPNSEENLSTGPCCSTNIHSQNFNSVQNDTKDCLRYQSILHLKKCLYQSNQDNKSTRTTKTTQTSSCSVGKRCCSETDIFPGNLDLKYSQEKYKSEDQLLTKPTCSSWLQQEHPVPDKWECKRSVNNMMTAKSDYNCLCSKLSMSSVCMGNSSFGQTFKFMF